MKGLNKILDKINKDSKAKSEAIIEDAKRKCDEIMSQAEENGKNAAEEIISSAKRESENIIKMACSSIEQVEKRAILEAKVKLLNDTLEKLFIALLELPLDKYFDLLIKLAGENAMKGKCFVKLSARDIARLPENFESRIISTLAAKDSTCILSKEAANIDGGLILIYGDVEVNCSFRAIIDANADIYKAKISEIIF